jgi:chromosome segregation ATPase
MTNDHEPEEPVIDLKEILEEDHPPPAPGSEGTPPPRAHRNVLKAAAPVPPPLPKRPGQARKAKADDPFLEPVEPRMPRGLPEQKVEYFRAVLKQKQETLARARSLYAEHEQEIEHLHQSNAELKAHFEGMEAELQHLRSLASRIQGLDGELKMERDAAQQASSRAERAEHELISRAKQAEARGEELEGELKLSLENGKLLSNSLAEVELQLPQLKEQLEQQRTASLSTAAELAEAKEALRLAQEEVADLEAKKSEAQGNLDAITEQYQAVITENERLTTQVETTSANIERATEELKAQMERASQELKSVWAERNQAVQERDAVRGETQGLQTRIEELEIELADAKTRAEGQSRQAAQELEAQASALDAEAASLRDEVEQLKAQLSHLQSEKAQVRQQADQHARRIKEELTASTQRKIAEVQTALMSEEQRRAESEALLAEAEGRAEHLAHQVSALEQQVGASKSDQGAVRRLQEEVANTQRRAMELQTLLQKERRDKDLLEKRAASADGGRKELTDRIATLETTIARLRSESESLKAPAAHSPSAELLWERDKLRADLISMKKKLVAAESAIEAAASLKLKVARLEAMLKGKK